ncbi:arylmalonate decarboxylase [Croceicoccus sp. Ery5]|uniref:maleate cis-trans isomerase family protein n=1 Tax=Croceicoccus sp. Ery5 TaxID=1703340 RepID=UPI001E343818|nr:arylmalonate decarboxylase [Croceicoccus sp. Ery5]
MVDLLGWRSIIGIVMPSTNTSVQPECDDLRPRGVTNHIARISIPERKIDSEDSFAAHVESMRSGIGPAVDQVMTCQPQHLIMGVALEAFWGGVDKAEELRKSLEDRAGVGVSMGSDALRAALSCFGSKRLAVLTPHQPRGDEVVRHYLEDAGFEVVRLKGLKCKTPRMIAHTTEEDVREAYRELDGDDVDTIVQVGTNLAGMRVSAEAERWLGKPVLSMNMLTYWNALRRLGIEDRIHGYGRLLEEF